MVQSRLLQAAAPDLASSQARGLRGSPPPRPSGKTATAEKPILLRCQEANATGRTQVIRVLSYPPTIYQTWLCSQLHFPSPATSNLRPPP